MCRSHYQQPDYIGGLLSCKVLKISYDMPYAEIQIPKFWHPTEIRLPSKTLDFPLPCSRDGPTNFGGSEGLSYEAEAVRQCLLRGMHHPSPVQVPL